MAIRLVGSSPSVSEQNIEKVEENLKLKFPEHHRNMLLQNNGGVLEGERCIYINDDHEFDVKYFLPVFHAKSDGILTVESLYVSLVKEKKILPEFFLPLAIDGGGFPFCIDIRDGSINFYNIEGNRNVRLENNLEDFVDKIVSEDEAWG